MTKQVLTTDYAVQSLRDSLGDEQLLAFAGALITAVEGAHNQLATDVNNFEVQVQQDLAQLGTLVQQAQAAADRLDEYEKGQIEAILQGLLNNSALQDLFAQLGVTLNGTSYSLTSVVQAISLAEKEVKTEVTYDALGGMSGVKVTLASGAISTFAATVADDGNGLLSADFVTSDFAGVPAAFSAKFRKVAKSLTAFGASLTLNQVRNVERTNIVIDLIGRFTPSAPMASPIQVPDANANGVIGS